MKTKQTTCRIRNLFRMKFTPLLAVLSLVAQGFAGPTGEPGDPSTGAENNQDSANQKEQPRDQGIEKASLDLSRYIKPHKWDFKNGLAGWKNIVESSEVGYGVSYSGDPGHGAVKKWRWQKGFRVESPPLQVVENRHGSTLLAMKPVKQVIPKNPPDVFGYVNCWFVSPYVDLSLNEGDTFEIEYRGDLPMGVYLLFSENDRDKWLVGKEISTTSQGYKKLSFDLETSRVFTPDKDKRKFAQLRKAQVLLMVHIRAEKFVVGTEWVPFEIKNIVTPPLYDESFEPLSRKDKPMISLGDDSMVHVRWENGVLESSEGPAGPWQTEAGESPLRFDTVEGMKFFRLRARVEGD